MLSLLSAMFLLAAAPAASIFHLGVIHSWQWAILLMALLICHKHLHYSKFLHLLGPSSLALPAFHLGADNGCFACLISDFLVFGKLIRSFGIEITMKELQLHSLESLALCHPKLCSSSLCFAQRKQRHLALSLRCLEEMSASGHLHSNPVELLVG